MTAGAIMALKALSNKMADYQVRRGPESMWNRPPP